MMARVRAKFDDRQAILWAFVFFMVRPAGLVVADENVDTPDDDQSTAPRLFIEPIAGLTTTRHLAPSETAIPLGTVLELFLEVPGDAQVNFSGAMVTSRSSEGVTATCFLDQLGPALVAAISELSDGTRHMSACRLDVVSIAISDISATVTTPTVAPFDLDQYATNAETMSAYFGESIADLVETTTQVNGAAGVDGQRTRSRPASVTRRFRTSTSRRINFQADVNPPSLAPLMEWRIDGLATALGAQRKETFTSVGAHTVSVGPPDRPIGVVMDTYSVSMTSHESADLVPEGEWITFEAVTDPPGLESGITWVSSTKYGTAEPVRGAGPTFTVQFNDTWGDDPANGNFQWLGVRADNAVFGQDQKTPKVIITDTFDQELPSVVETFWQVVFNPGDDPPVNEIGFKAKILNLGGLTVMNYEWTIDAQMGDLTPLGGINPGQAASYSCCGTALHHPMPPTNTALVGPIACAVEFKSWMGRMGVGTKSVQVEVTLSNAAVISDQIEVKVLSYLTETVPGTTRGHALLEEHYGWHTCFDQGSCDADGPDNALGTPDDNPFWNVGAAAELPAPHKDGYMFLKFHRRFAVNDMAAYRTVAGLDPVPETAHIPLIFPNPLRDGGGPQAPEVEPAQVDCPGTGSSTPQHISPVPDNLNPPVGFATSHLLGLDALAWHINRHNNYCSHGDLPGFTSPRDISLYWFHKAIDDVWTAWLNANAGAPHFYVIIAAQDPGPGGSITQADLSSVGINVTFSDAVTEVKKEDLTLTDTAGSKVATSVSGSGVGPYTFEFLDVPDPGLVTVTLSKGTIQHQDPTDPVNPPRHNPLENDESWEITVVPSPS